LFDGNSTPVKALLEINGESLKASLLHLTPNVGKFVLTKLAGRQAGCHLNRGARL
jgi:hypothetical protein